MKRLSIVIVVVGWLVLVGYAAARPGLSPSPVRANATVTPLIPGPYPTARVPNELTYYTKRCWPACHYDPAWQSEEPNRITEEFEGALGEGWSWINEDEALWSVDASAGTLTIASSPQSVREPGEDVSSVTNVLVHDAPAKHFDVLTKVTFDPSDEFQNAGIFMELDDGAVISLDRGYCEPASDPSCEGHGVYLDGTGAGGDYFGVPLTEDTVCLMLRKAGNSYIGYYHLSEPGETTMPTHMGWTEVGRVYRPDGTAEMAGLAVSSGEPNAGQVAAEFEVITLVERK